MSYSPKVRFDLVRKLYLLKHSSPDKKPMTRIVNEAIEQYFERKENAKQKDDTNSNENDRINNSNS